MLKYFKPQGIIYSDKRYSLSKICMKYQKISLFCQLHVQYEQDANAVDKLNSKLKAKLCNMAFTGIVTVV